MRLPSPLRGRVPRGSYLLVQRVLLTAGQAGYTDYDIAQPYRGPAGGPSRGSTVESRSGGAMSWQAEIEARRARRDRVYGWFRTDPAHAFDALAPWLDPLEPAMVEAALAVFRPSGFRREGPVWDLPEARRWIVDDPRWLAFALRHRRHPAIGLAARSALRYVPRRALDRAIADDVRRFPPVVVPAPSPEARAASLARARAEMAEMAASMDRIATSLAARGWHALSGRPRTAPGPEDAAVIERIESLTGAPLPAALTAFWEVVGGVDLVWDYERGPAPQLLAGIDLAALDPLCVDPAARIGWCVDEWIDENRGIPDEIAEPLRLDLAPDRLHKANISGGPAYHVLLPTPDDDPMWVDEVPGRTFTAMLRECLRWGGFPGLARHGDRPDVRAFVASLRGG